MRMGERGLSQGAMIAIIVGVVVAVVVPVTIAAVLLIGGGGAPGGLPVYSGATHIKSITQDSTQIAYYNMDTLDGSVVYNWYKSNVPTGWTFYGESGYTSGSGGYVIYTKGNEIAAVQVLEGTSATDLGLNASKVLGISYASGTSS